MVLPLSLSVLLLNNWIVKQSRRGRLLEHLELSGTKAMMSRHTVHKLCVGRNRETNKKSLKVKNEDFHILRGFLRHQFTTRAKASRHIWSFSAGNSG